MRLLSKIARAIQKSNNVPNLIDKHIELKMERLTIYLRTSNHYLGHSINLKSDKAHEHLDNIISKLEKFAKDETDRAIA